MANYSDLESVLTTAEWAQPGDMSKLHEFSYVVWTGTLFQGQIFELSTDVRYPSKRIGEGPPMNLVAAGTFLYMATGRICEVDNEELSQATCAQVENAEACEPIPLPVRIKLRVVHYYDPTKWKPRGNWANGRWVDWTKKTTRPMEIWPELWNTTAPAAQQQVAVEWRKEVQRRAERDRAARKHKIIRGRGKAPDPIAEEEPPLEMAAAACHFNMEAWKPWLREVCKL
jgi:hypothetical protein